jgi:uncharacterized protein
MLTVDLSELRRRGSIPLRATISGDDSLWGELEFALPGGVTVDLTAEESASEQVIVRGRVLADVSHPCRRCLEEVREKVEFPVFLVWAPNAGLADDEDGEGIGEDEVRLLDPRAAVLDVTPAIREEVLLAVPAFPLCREDCRGLCPVCGVNRNLEECSCDLAKSEDRWEGLRILSDDSGLR